MDTSLATDSEIVFSTPPPAPERVAMMAKKLAPLKEAPGEWGRIRTGTRKTTLESYAGNIKSGLHKDIAKGEFDTTVGPIPEDEWETIVLTNAETGESTTTTVETFGVWVRYVGHLSPQPVDEDEADVAVSDDEAGPVEEHVPSY